MSEEEEFEIFDAEGRLLGRMPRSRVHAEGHWHKSAHVYLYDDAGRLWMQKRVIDKDICGGLWDYSVGEHLQPGETFLEAAHRGLEEELGVRESALVCLGEPRKGRAEFPELGILDCELQQAFKGVHDGPVTANAAEVEKMRAVTLAELERWVSARPADFTPWFLRDLEVYGIL
ncbi:MAG: NUDIX domain-containing protein [Pseudomonadales bacterium]|nr:NUDIX domain-containing protein [Pseudomonadales bacterium]